MIDFITVASSQKHFTEIIIHGKVLPCNEVMNDSCHTGRHCHTGIQSGFLKGRKVPLLQLVQVLLISVGWS